MRVSSVLLQGAALLALVSLAGVAEATPEFPDAMRAHLKMSSSPPCDVCHADGVTGGGTVTTPFGRSARARGLVADNEDVLFGVLDRMAGEKVDSDNDGIPDIDELIASTDPNSAAGNTVGPQEFGCVGRVASGQGERGASLLAAALVALALRRSRR